MLRVVILLTGAFLSLLLGVYSAWNLLFPGGDGLPWFFLAPLLFILSFALVIRAAIITQRVQQRKGDQVP